jgi:two-component system NtrC family response regulator
LESGEIRRVGDNDSFTVDTRVVCATHRNLEEMVAQGEFREDLMYRINTFEIYVPPLRNHAGDVPELAHHLLGRFRYGQGTRELTISDEALEHLQRHCWPGNVRELANCIEHAAILCEDGIIRPDDLPEKLTSRQLNGPHFKLIGSLALKEIEVQVIRQVLQRNGGNKPEAAEELGISLKTLYNKLNQADEQRKSA